MYFSCMWAVPSKVISLFHHQSDYADRELFCDISFPYIWLVYYAEAKYVPTCRYTEFGIDDDILFASVEISSQC